MRPLTRNRRQVQWLKDFPRTHFSQGSLHEIGSAISFFSVKTCADEFRTAVEGKALERVPVSEDETVTAVAEDIEEQTRDYILKKLAQELKGGSFEDFIANLLRVMGYKTRQPKRGKGADGGVDIIAYKDELGFEPPIIKVQVKSKEGPAVILRYQRCMASVTRTNTLSSSLSVIFLIRPRLLLATNQTYV
jgi:restriction system protein